MKQAIEKPSEAFVERPQSETDRGAGRPQRLSLRLTDEGTVDWEQVSESQKEKFYNAVLNDPDALERIATAVGGDAIEVEDPLAVKPKHIGYFLDGFAWLERQVLPKYIAKKSNNQVIITPEIAHQAFSFTDEQKQEMGPDGAAFANESIMPHLPEWLREWLLKVGPGTKFFGALIACGLEQTKAAVKLAVQTNPQPVQQQNPNPVDTSVN